MKDSEITPLTVPPNSGSNSGPGKAEDRAEADPELIAPELLTKIARADKQIAAGQLQSARDTLKALPQDKIPAHRLMLTRAGLAKASGDMLGWLTQSAAAYTADPSRPACYGNYALVLQALGQDALADDVVHQAMAEAPRAAPPYFWRARLSEQQNNLKGALEAVTKALKYAPEGAKIRRLRLQLWIHAGKHEEALEDLKTLQAAEPDDKTLCRRGIKIARNLGDAELEMAQSKRLVALSRTAGDLRAHIDRLFAADAHGAVLPFLEEAVRPAPDAVPILAETAGRLDGAGQSAVALRAVDLAIAAGGKPKLHVLRARILRQMDRPRAAERALRNTARRAPQEIRAHQALVETLLGDTRPRAALKALRWARTHHPGDLTLALIQVQTLKTMGRLDEASAALDRLRHFATLSAKDTLIVAKLYAGLGQRSAELEVLSAALKQQSSHPAVLEYALRRAIGYIPRPRIEPMMRLLETWAETRFPDHLWRRLYMQDLDLDAAVETRKGAFGKAGRDAVAASDLAKVLIASHRYALALRYLRLCRRRWPDHKGLITQSFDAMIRFGRIAEARALFEEVAEHPGAPLDKFDVMLELYESPGRRLPILKDYARLRNLPVKSLEILLRNTLATADWAAAEALHNALDDKNAESIERSWWSSYLGQIVIELQLLARDYGASGPEELVLPESDEALRAEMRAKSWSTVLASVLVTRSVAAGYLTQPSGAADRPIPKVIYQYWDTQPPEAVQQLSQSWSRATGYEYQMFDKASALAFLREECGPRWVQAFRLARRPEEEADFFRLALLVRKGGIWADADDRLYGDLDQLLPKQAGLVLFREPAANAIGNNFIAVRPGHPVLHVAERWVMQGILQRSNEKLWLKSGPGMMMRAVAWYIAEVGAETASRDLVLPGQELLRQQVSIHNRLDHKMTDKYWNSRQRRDPGYLDLLSQIADEAKTGLGVEDGPAPQEGQATEPSA